MGTVEEVLGVTLRWTSIPSRGSDDHATETRPSKGTGHNKCDRREPTLPGVGGLSKTPPISRTLSTKILLALKFELTHKFSASARVSIAR